MITKLDWSGLGKKDGLKNWRKQITKSSLPEFCYKGDEWVEGNNRSRKSFLFKKKALQHVT